MTGTLPTALLSAALAEDTEWQREAAPIWSSAQQLFDEHAYVTRVADGGTLYPELAAPRPWTETVASRLAGLPGHPELLLEDNEYIIVGARFPVLLGDVALTVEIPKDSSLGASSTAPTWTPDAALRSLTLLQRQVEFERHAAYRLRELEATSEECSRTYEEISLLHHLASNLRVTEHPEHLAERAVDWLQECLPVEGVFLELYEFTDDSKLSQRQVKLSYVAGELPLESRTLREFFQDLSLVDGNKPLVANGNNEFGDDTLPPGVHHLVAVPIVEGPLLFGHLALINHTGHGEFGTIEASLATTIASILGVHAGNSRLYGKQASLLENVVRAMVSAIDAKDPYTCGHSNRVAQVSVQLSKTLGLSDEECDTIYLSGLLHDIGKIGVDDAVLQKDGRLTAEEYEHIKRHPVLGARILADIEQFSEILPGVLYHHEQWNGNGYPEGLEGENIPRIARIIAVADAFDAMTSDRPYRQGMPVDRVEEIFKAGRNTQWEGRIIDAYFAARERITAIINEERRDLPLSVATWSSQRSKTLRDSSHVSPLRDAAIGDSG